MFAAGVAALEPGQGVGGLKAGSVGAAAAGLSERLRSVWGIGNFTLTRMDSWMWNSREMPLRLLS